MAEWSGGRTTGGGRSQFRLGLAGLGQCRGLYPVQFGNIMDIGHSSQTGVISRDHVSPSKGTCTRTVREYEETISELKKENFQLKLDLFLKDEARKKSTSKDCQSPTNDPIDVIVKLNLETQSLENDLSYKNKLLEDALEKAEKYENDFKELEKKCAELQSQLTSLSELPSKEEYFSLLEEKENLLKHVESLEATLREKEEEIDMQNQRMEILAEQNKLLEDKLEKRSLAIRGFVYKNYQEKELLPDELRNIVIYATQAAKKRHKDDLVTAIKAFSAKLNEMYSVRASNSSEEKENIATPQDKCLKEEVLEKSCAFLPSQNESFKDVSLSQVRKET